MFYKVELKDHIRVPPKLFHLTTEDSVVQRIRKNYEGFISKELGIVIDVAGIKTIGEGVIIHGDGAAYYDVTFELYTFKPEVQEAVAGIIRDIADFGAFMNLGPIEGMIHVSQTMDDFVTFSKDKTLSGRDSKRILKVNDRCKARIIAVSYKDMNNPKIGLTMRQPFLGRADWFSTDARVKKEEGKESVKEAKEKPAKGKKK